MPVSRRTFYQGLDSDTAPGSATRPHALRNVVLERGRVEAAYGTVALPVADGMPAGELRNVLSAEDVAAQLLYLLWHHPGGAHTLTCLDLTTDAHTLLLTWPGLRLPATPSLNAGFVDGFVVYNDADGEARCLPVARVAAGHYTPAVLAAEPYCLHLIKHPPMVTPAAERLVLPGAAGNAVAAHAYQFATRYRYADAEVSVFSPWSAVNFPRYLLVAGVYTPDAANAVRVSLPAAWPALVTELEVLVRADAQPSWTVAARLPRPASGPVPASFDFVGATLGETVPDVDALKTHEVAWPAQALGLARNHVWRANLREGYPTPQPALAVSITEVPDGATTETVWRLSTDFTVTYNDPQYGDVTETQTRVEYFVLESGSYPDPGSTYRPAVVVPGGFAVDSGVPARTYAQAFSSGEPNDVFDSEVVLPLTGQIVQRSAGTGAFAAQATVPERSTYQVGIEFFDALGRPGAVGSVAAVTTGPNPARALRRIAWQLTGTAAAEIPAWARTYQLCLSPNTSKTFFRQFFAVNAAMLQYLGRNGAGAPAFAALGSNAGALGMWISTEALGPEGLGYTFAPGSGDRLRFVDEDGEDYPILAQEAYQDKVYLSIARRPGTTYNPPSARIEVYTPNTVQAGEAAPFYERGPRYAVTTATAPDGAVMRGYSVTAGVLDGDAWRRPLAGAGSADPDTLLEAVLPSPQTATTWLDARRGRPAVALPRDLQVTRRPVDIRFSGVRLTGTRANGLGVWDELSLEQRVPPEAGPVVALAVASQTQSLGTVLVAVQTDGAASLYLGQVPLAAADGGEVLALADRVVGDVRPLQCYGTRHPGSVAAWKGVVYWWNQEHATQVRYAANGAVALAEQEQVLGRARCRELADTYAGRTVHGAFDPATRSYLTLFDGYTAAEAEEAGYALRGAALAFSERVGALADTWELDPGRAVGAGRRLLSLRDNRPHRHDPAAPRLRFYGVDHAARVACWLGGEAGSLSKTWQQLAEEATEAWTPVLLRANGRREQRSRMLPAWLANIEGVWRGAIRRDETSPGFDSLAAALNGGQELQAPLLEVVLEYEGTGTGALVAVEAGYLINTGQQPNQ